jgi:hypothetical protein
LVGVEDVGMARTPYRIELSESEERELRRREQTRAYREVLRAKIVLLAAAGLENAEIARHDTGGGESLAEALSRGAAAGAGGSSPPRPASALFPPRQSPR